MNPRITAIIPTYRRPQLLKRAIESVLRQSYPHFYLCIYDDASGDDTEELVKSFMENDKRIFFHRQPHNIGSNPNFLYGLERVDTPFFVFLADDDFFLPTFFEEAMALFDRYPQAGMVFGGLLVKDPQHRLVAFDLYAWAEKECYAPREWLFHLAKGAPLPYFAATLFRREVKEKIGLLNPEIIWHDVDYLLRAIPVFPVAFCKRPCMVFSQHETNLSRTISAQQFLELRLRYSALMHEIFSAEGETHLRSGLQHHTRKALFSFTLQKFARADFKEMVSGFALLEARYALSPKEKLAKALALFFSQHRVAFYVLTPLFYLRRRVARFLTFQKLKTQCPKKELSIV